MTNNTDSFHFHICKSYCTITQVHYCKFQMSPFYDLLATLQHTIHVCIENQISCMYLVTIKQISRKCPLPLTTFPASYILLKFVALDFANRENDAICLNVPSQFTTFICFVIHKIYYSHFLYQKRLLFFIASRQDDFVLWDSNEGQQ